MARDLTTQTKLRKAKRVGGSLVLKDIDNSNRITNREFFKYDEDGKLVEYECTHAVGHKTMTDDERNLCEVSVDELAKYHQDENIRN